MSEKLFFYKALSPLSQVRQGTILAPNKQIAQHLLLAKGFSQIHLAQDWRLSSKPNNAEICALLNQLAMLLQAAIELKQALIIACDNCTQSALYQWLKNLILHLETGLSFSQAIELQGKYLNYQEVQLIQAGELAGQLAKVCQHIADHRKRALALNRKLQKIMLYPSMVLGISFGLTLILLLFVVPQFAAMYGDNGANLPPLTAILLYLSQMLEQHYLLFLGAVSLSASAWYYASQHSLGFQQVKARLLQKMPLFGKIAALSRLVQFSHSLTLMLQAGVPLNQALQSFLGKQQSWQKKPKLQGDPLLQQEIRQLLQWLEQGYPLAESVSSQLFPQSAQQMLAIGEQSGRLPEMLHNIAQEYQNKLDHQIDLLSQLLEPLLMVIIGGLIGIIMLGMYLPIFNMGSVIQ